MCFDMHFHEASKKARTINTTVLELNDSGGRLSRLLYHMPEMSKVNHIYAIIF